MLTASRPTPQHFSPNFPRDASFSFSHPSIDGRAPLGGKRRPEVGSEALWGPEARPWVRLEVEIQPLAGRPMVAAQLRVNLTYRWDVLRASLRSRKSSFILEAGRPIQDLTYLSMSRDSCWKDVNVRRKVKEKEFSQGKRRATRKESGI